MNKNSSVQTQTVVPKTDNENNENIETQDIIDGMVIFLKKMIDF